MVVTADPDLAAAVEQHLPAAAVDVVGDVAVARVRWSDARRVLVGPDRCLALVRLGLPPRPGVAVLLPPPGSPPDPDWATSAVQLGIERLIDLDDAADWLGTPLFPTDAGIRTMPAPTRLVVLTGSVGGVGVTTLAVALAVTCSRAHRRTLLLDLDPLGAGLDVALGLEDVPGPRWPDVIGPDRVDLDRLPTAVPRLSVLAHAGEPVVPEPVAEVLAAADGYDVVIADLARRDLPSSLRLDAACAVLLISPLDVRGTAAAARRLPGLTRDVAPRLVARGRPGSTVSADAVSGALGLPLAGLLRHDRRLARTDDEGTRSGVRRRSGPAVLARALAADLGLVPTPHRRRAGRRAGGP